MRRPSSITRGNLSREQSRKNIWRLSGASGVIDRAIGRHRGDRKKMSSRNALARARDAQTAWEIEQCFRAGTRPDRPLWVSLLRLRPHTGRTHQIRVHLADEQMPVVGDATYGLKSLALARLRDDASAFPELCRFPQLGSACGRERA